MENKKSIKNVLIMDIIVLFAMFLVIVSLIYNIINLSMSDEAIYVFMQIFLWGYIVIGIVEGIFVKVSGKLSVLSIINIGFAILDLIVLISLGMNSDVDITILFILVLMFGGIVVIFITLISRVFTYYKNFVVNKHDYKEEKVVSEENEVSIDDNSGEDRIDMEEEII